MLTRRFTFFCMMSVWGLMFSRLPIIQNIMPAGFLIVVLVSGWKYAFYYLAITTIPAIPSYWNTLVFLSQSGPYWTMVDEIRTGHLSSVMQSIGISLPVTSAF